MISIIICSCKENFFQQVIKSIDETINLPYEIVKIDNSQGQYGICKAYNLGAKKASFDYLCFLHEDIIFKSGDWGNKLINFFITQQNTGIIGIAGSRYKSLCPSSWAQGLFETDYINIVQCYGKETSHVNNLEQKGYVEVVTLDGVFLFTHKHVWKDNKFDEVKFDRFHCYDLDFCLQVAQNRKLFVSNEVLIEHFSSGDLNRDWVNYSITLAEKWKNSLPKGDLPGHQQKEIEWRNRKIFFFRMNILNYSLLSSLKVFLKWGFFTNFSLPKTFHFIKDIILTKLKISNKRFY